MNEIRNQLVIRPLIVLLVSAMMLATEVVPGRCAEALPSFVTLPAGHGILPPVEFAFGGKTYLCRMAGPGAPSGNWLLVTRRGAGGVEEDIPPAELMSVLAAWGWRNGAADYRWASGWDRLADRIEEEELPNFDISKAQAINLLLTGGSVTLNVAGFMITGGASSSLSTAALFLGSSSDVQGFFRTETAQPPDASMLWFLAALRYLATVEDVVKYRDFLAASSRYSTLLGFTGEMTGKVALAMDLAHESLQAAEALRTLTTGAGYATLAQTTLSTQALVHADVFGGLGVTVAADLIKGNVTDLGVILTRAIKTGYLHVQMEISLARQIARALRRHEAGDWRDAADAFRQDLDLWNLTRLMLRVREERYAVHAAFLEQARSIGWVKGRFVAPKHVVDQARANATRATAERERFDESFARAQEQLSRSAAMNAAARGAGGSGGAAAGVDYLVLFHNNALQLIREVREDEQDISYHIDLDLEGGGNLLRVFLLDRYTPGMTPRDLTADNILAASSSQSYNANLELLDLMLTLSWDTDRSDVDLHLVPQTMDNFDRRDADCFFDNKKPSWGSADNNPELDIDDIDGYGPENIVVSKLKDGRYYVVVHYFADHGAGVTNASVTLRIQGAMPLHYGPIRLAVNKAREVVAEVEVRNGVITHSSSHQESRQRTPGGRP